MAKFPEAQQRLFTNVFVCKKCKSKRRSLPKIVINNKLTCKRCGSHAFRTLRKAK